MSILFNKKIYNILLYFLIFTIIILPFCPVMAAEESGSILPNPIRCGDFECLLIGIVKIALGFVAVFALFIFIYGGFLMLSSGGNPETIKKAKDILVWASLGMVVIIGSWAFVHYFLGIVSTTTR
jgi:hypothetical protein